jgi:4-amino-4-deoxy-L-arabinose transferase-like glycosyltransferase
MCAATVGRHVPAHGLHLNVSALESFARSRAFDGVAIACLALPLFAFNAAERPVTGVLEERVAITSREMWRAGEWIVPTMNGEIRLQKPPLAYWMAEGFAACRGVFDDWTLRFPFAILSVGTALLVGCAGKALAGPNAGLLAAIALLTSALFVKEGHLATPDPVLFFSAAGAWLFQIRARQRLERGPNAIDRIALHAFLSLGFLAKGPVILLLVLAPSLLEAVVARSRDPLRPFWSPIGIGLFALAAVFWPLAVIYELGHRGNDGLAAVRVWYLESFGKVLPSSGVEDGYKFHRHPGPWYFYLPRLFPAFGIWSPILLASLWLEARSRVARFPWLLFVFILVTFSAIAEKKSAYMLPLAGPGALLVGILLESHYPRYRSGLRVATKVLLPVAAVWLGTCAAWATWPERAARLVTAMTGDEGRLVIQAFALRPMVLLFFGALPLAGVIVLSKLLVRDGPRAPFLALGAVLVAATTAYTTLKNGIPEEEGDMRRAASALSSTLAPTQAVFCLGGRSVGAVGSLPGGLVYYLDRLVTLIDERHLETLATVPRGGALLVSETRLVRCSKSGVPEQPLAPGEERSSFDEGSHRFHALDRPDGALAGFIVRSVVNPEAVSPGDRVYFLERESGAEPGR